MFQAYFEVLLIVGGGELMTIEGLSQSILNYQLLALATSQILGDNREFDISDILFYPLLMEHCFRTLKIHHWLPLIK